MKKTIFFALLLQGLSICAQTTYFVNQNAVGLQTGSSWANAFPDLQQALSLAQSGDAIWVATGIYMPSDTDRTVSFRLVSGTGLYGGFTGTETALEQRNPVLHPTILSGEIGDTAIRQDNSYHVVRGKGLDDHTRIDGFTITAGYCYELFSASDLDGLGGGMLLEGSAEQANSQPVISHCIFENNAAYGGGGLSTTWVDPAFPLIDRHLVNPVLRQCTFRHNQAYQRGGGVNLNSPTASGDTITIRDCSFGNNMVEWGNGGGLYYGQTENTHARLINCLFEYDTSIYGSRGGAILFSLIQLDSTFSSLNMDSCIFRGNRAGTGAGLCVGTSITPWKGIQFACRITHSIFEENEVGEAYLINSTDEGSVNVFISDCIIRNNLSTNSTTVISADDHGDTQINRCIFWNNTDGNLQDPYSWAVQTGAGPNSIIRTRINNCIFAWNGGAVSAYSYGKNQMTTEITNCTFYRNFNRTFLNNDGLEYNDSSYHHDMYLNNCVVWEPNTDDLRLFSNGSGSNGTTGFHVEHSMITVPPDFFLRPGAQEVFGEGVIFNTNPGFVDTLAGDFHLLDCISPAIDAGKNIVADTFGLVTDFDGNPRIFKGLVDLGAYESQDSCIIISSVEPSNLGLVAVLSPNPAQPGQQMKVSISNSEQNKIQWKLWNARQRNIASGTSSFSGDKFLHIAAPNDSGLYFLELHIGLLATWLKLVVQ